MTTTSPQDTESSSSLWRRAERTDLSERTGTVSAGLGRLWTDWPVPRSRTWPCTVRCSDLAPGIRGRKHKLQMFPLHRGLQRLSAGCRHWQVATFFPLIGHWSEVCFSHLFFFFNLSSGVSFMKYLWQDTVCLLQCCRFWKRWRKYPGVDLKTYKRSQHSWGHTNLSSFPNTDPLCSSDLFITSPTNPAVPLSSLE